jgi:ribosomal protein S27AE
VATVRKVIRIDGPSMAETLCGNHFRVTCGDCGHVGELLVRTMSATNVSSSNLRMVCAKCNSTNWTLPGGEKRKP